MTAHLYLGLDTGGTDTKYVVASRDGQHLHQGEVPTDPRDAAATLDRVVAVVAETCGGEGLPQLAGVGLACAGIVDPERLVLGRSPNLPGWGNLDLGAELRRVFPAASLDVLNDVNGALYGEYRAGAGRGCRDLVMLALGTGVGGGVMVGGELIVGGRSGAGELGHMVLDLDGPLCACGNHGCLEAWAGSTALLRRGREIAADAAADRAALAALVVDRGDALTTRDLADLAGAGDAATGAVFAQAGRRLGQAVGNLINALDPDKVIVGGGVARAGDLILEPCRAEARRIVLNEAALATPIVPAELGPLAAAVGAAWYARERGDTV